ncbi:ABC transporter ATP-binding protein [Leptolyngbya sp. NK1-12]|uniref:ABC transporter ATP-binding protein n=1 Tax=Leptolyngbya sp. NK1-12 TaxID=2547451 RepID=A0AA96WLF9_9CYAN|nr:ABC transporter ATP-binding protein [Leptolyngbya sp. NK1-12]WNZ27673.1 ABC transporter ATP-binding protein [Leptolyngbya sp. NK1-12]
MLKFITKFLYVLQDKKKALLIMIILFLVVSLMEALGTGMVGPFITLATHPNAVQENVLLNRIYTAFSFASPHQFLILTGCLIIVVFYLKAILSFKAQKYIFDFSFGQQGELSSRLMRLYLAAPYTFHLDRNSAALIQNIVNETHTVANGLLIPLLMSISNLVIIAALVVLLVATNVLATLVIAGILIASFVLFHQFKDRLSQWGKDGSDARTAMIRVINHGLGGLKETRVIGCEAHFEKQLQEQAQKFATSSSLAVSFSNLPRYMIEAVLITFLIIFTFLFLVLNQQNAQNLSAVLGIFALASIRLLPAAGNLLSSINGIRYNSYALDKLYLDLKELEQFQSRTFDASGMTRQAADSSYCEHMTFLHQIALNNVTYAYPNSSANALQGISLNIRKGQSIGLIGKSGAGKTTLVDVILGLLIPQSGDIQVDGVSIYENLRAWQNIIAYVPQSIFLIDDTLEHNVAFGVPKHLIDQDRLWKAIEAAQLSELVEQLPSGIDTMVGERGVLLSGGQRQRVGIARALYHEREILVFDEATAALDNETEELVTEAIKSLSGIKTMIIIAHRLSTIEHCDCIYSLQEGRVFKSGTYEEVVLT